MIKIIIIILLIFLSLFTCSDKLQDNDQLNLSQIYQSRDRHAFSELIEEKHIYVRGKLNEQLDNYLKFRVDSIYAVWDSVFTEIDWFLSIYTEDTGCNDLLEKSKLYRNWSDSQISFRFALDDNTREIISSTDSTDLFIIIEDLSKLALQYNALGDYFRSARIGYRQGRICYDNNNLSIALPYLQQALTSCHLVHDYDTEAKVQLLINKFYIVCESDYHRAEKALSRGFECLELIDDYPMLGFFYKHQAFNFMSSLETRKALDGYTNALNEFTLAKSNVGIAECNYFIGETYYYMNEFDSAIYYGIKSLTLRRELASKDPILLSKVGISLSNLGLYMASVGDTALAIERFNEADAILDNASDEKAICINRLHKALILVKLNRVDEARELLNYTFENTQRFEDKTMTLFGLVLCDYYEGKQRSAISKLNSCIYRLELSRDNIPVTEYKNGMLSDKIVFYHLMSNIFIERYHTSKNYDDLDSAFSYFERSKAKTLYDMLLASSTKDTALEPLYDSLIGLISDYENKLLDQSSANLSLRTEMQDVGRLLHRLRIENTAFFSDSHTDTNYNFPNLSETQQVLKKDEILLAYMISEFGSYVFTIGSETIEIISLSVGAQQINDMTVQYCSALKRRPQQNQLPEKLSTLGKDLYATLFPPKLEEQIKGKDLTIIASAKLHYLPFESLIDNAGEFMVENYEISYIPSMTVRRQLSRREVSPSDNIFAFGNPLYSSSFLDPLPYSDEEVDCLADIFGQEHTHVFKGIDATETNFMEIDFKNARILHIASHGITDDHKPGKSALLFASTDTSEGHSMLHSDEIANLSIPVDLVFLSACRSGAGSSFPGEGVLSLCQPFLVAGCNSVIASYWSINDRCSVEIVKSFYGYLKDGYSKAQSLTLAKRDLLQHKRMAWRHPYYWAPFVMMGLDN